MAKIYPTFTDDFHSSLGEYKIFNALKKLVEEGYIEKYGEKQQAYYVKKSTFAW